MNVTRKRTFGKHRGEYYSLVQYNHDFTRADCDHDGSNERNHFLVPPRIYAAKAPAGIKRALHPIPQNIFVKYPRLEIDYDTRDFDNLKKRTLREVRFCELLRTSPHPSIAQYQGCIVIDGYNRGICFTRYETTLADLVDPLPGSRKEDFRYGADGNPTLPKSRAHFLATLEAGVEHLHSLGYVHNDLKIDNLMVKRDGGAVIIDFDSVLKRGEATKGVPRTPGWHDPMKRIAEPESDWDAVGDVEEWLSDKEVKEFRLPGYKKCLELMGM